MLRMLRPAALHKTMADEARPLQVKKAQKAAAGSRWGASYSAQLHILFIRAIKTRRFDSMSSQDFFQFIVVGILTGGLLSQWSLLASQSWQCLSWQRLRCSRPSTSLPHVLPLCCQRNRCRARDRRALMHRLPHAGLFWWQQGRGDTVYSAQNSNGLLFFEVCSLAWTGALQVA